MGDRVHIVRAGECLTTIAAHHGLSWQSVWEHRDNASLRERRGHPGVLRAGDRVHLPAPSEPSLNVSPGGSHRFKGTRGRAEVHLSVGGASRPYRLEADGETIEGQTGDGGSINATVGAQVREAMLILDPDSDREERIPIVIGQLDPIDTVRGVKQRLHNLGHDLEPEGNDVTPELEHAVAAFREERDLGEGGLDGAVREALLDAHGC